MWDKSSQLFCNLLLDNPFHLEGIEGALDALRLPLHVETDCAIRHRPLKQRSDHVVRIWRSPYLQSLSSGAPLLLRNWKSMHAGTVVRRDESRPLEP